jgi:flavin reductase (DIM6/NTAB) family NADH-FMN oxidoreductase RutF
MAKKKLENLKVVKNLIYPYLPVLVGVNVHDKPNYITIGLIGWLCYDMMSVSIGHRQYSKTGIEENGTFSVNQPSAALVRELDYCGLKSGRDTNKAGLFDTFYGELGTAPMIRECPVNIECRVVQSLRRPVHAVYLGEVVAVHVNEDVLRNGTLSLPDVDPVFFAPDPREGKHVHSYWGLGKRLGAAFEIGKELERP